MRSYIEIIEHIITMSVRYGKNNCIKTNFLLISTFLFCFTYHLLEPRLNGEIWFSYR